MKKKEDIIANVILFIVSIIPFALGTCMVKFILMEGYLWEMLVVDSLIDMLFMLGVFIFIIGITLAWATIATLVKCIKKEKQDEENDIIEKNKSNLLYKYIMIIEVVIYIIILIFITVKY